MRRSRSRSRRRYPLGATSPRTQEVVPFPPGAEAGKQHWYCPDPGDPGSAPAPLPFYLKRVSHAPTLEPPLYLGQWTLQCAHDTCSLTGGCQSVVSFLCKICRMKFHSNPTLKYLYPPPSNIILTNITHALIAVPKFYVQVLHLMNKMNLPCPFGPVTARPPMFELLRPAPPIPMPPPLPPHYPPLPEEELERSGEEESEYESGDDEDKERIVRLMGLVNQACKRPLRPKTASKRKKPKIKDLLYTPKPDSQSAPVLQPSDVFENPNPAGLKKIEFHISSEAAAVVEGSQPDVDGKDESESASGSSNQEMAVAEGFGKLYPSAQSNQQQDEHSDDEQDLMSDVISRKELEKGRLSKDEIKRMSVFKNYEAGEPTCRLYVKNIAKPVEEKDLRYIYGRYVDLSSEAERNMFDIVLMKEGRMKGQAFIGLPNERIAEKALRETNGFVLNDKPLVVQFARSARPKQDNADSKKGPKQR
ncbi:RNA-binding region-containing protein 3 [Characodon lateralis]|uniref:RNA-binding region-containing protein 3 n=1 Tax=Characodon lateralis TaxID=208331 RepID=A0ABU7DZN8_9TELE|nr:RNA-binding region-containing protein 3 [Characodon lateralis]